VVLATTSAAATWAESGVAVCIRSPEPPRSADRGAEARHECPGSRRGARRFLVGTSLQGVFDPRFFTGISGVGYALLRLAVPYTLMPARRALPALARLTHAVQGCPRPRRSRDRGIFDHGTLPRSLDACGTAVAYAPLTPNWSRRSSVGNALAASAHHRQI
jgi:hypothetical protein